MRYLSTIGFAALLGLVAACSGTDMTPVAPVQPAYNKVIQGAEGISSGRMLTADETIAWLEARAQTDPAFLDVQRVYRTGDGEHSTTLRAVLNAYLASRDGVPHVVNQPSMVRQVANIASDSSPIILERATTLTDAVVGAQALVTASMAFVYRGNASDLGATQTITTVGIGAPIVFEYTKPTSTPSPWQVSGLMQFVSPGAITSTTVHTLSSPHGNDNASTSATASITNP
jgi:hypothetical protein